MGFLDNLLTNIKQTQAQSFAKGLCKAMLMSANAAQSKYPDKKYYSDYAILALETRPNWKKTNENIFEYKHGGKVTILQKDSLLDVTHKVAEVELARITKDMPTLEKTVLERDIYREIENYFHQENS